MESEADVGVSVILSPPDCIIIDSSYALISQVTNYGTGSQTFDVVFEVKIGEFDSPPDIADTATITAMSGSSVDTVTFTKTLEPTVDTIYYLVSYTALLGDENGLNDSSLATSHTVPSVIADFSADPTSGFAPLEVLFTDLSEGNPTSWLGDFGDDSTSTEQHPTHTYNDTGYFDVKLIASNECDSDTAIKESHIHVTPYINHIIHVPSDYPTIQEGIDASQDGDTVLACRSGALRT